MPSAKRLEENESLREDVRSYSDAGGVIYAECGGFMYLADQILVRNDQREKSGDGDGDGDGGEQGGDKGEYTARNMCGVFPITVRMTPHVKMYYAEMEFTSRNPIFPIGGRMEMGSKWIERVVLCIISSTGFNLVIVFRNGFSPSFGTYCSAGRR